MVRRKSLADAKQDSSSGSGSSVNGDGASGSRKIRKSEMVVARIREYILDNNLRAGDSLPTEAALAERFNVSRVSVREATQALAFMGIIDAAPRRGLSVGQFRMDRVSKYLSFHFAVSEYPFEDLIDARIIIETGGLKRAASRMATDGAIYDELNSINQSLGEATDPEVLASMDSEFHRRLAAASGLDALVVFNELLQVFFEHPHNGGSTNGKAQVVESHQTIIDALRDNNYDEATRELTGHIASYRVQNSQESGR